MSAGSELTHYAHHARPLHWQVAYWRVLGGLLVALGLLRWGAAIGAVPSTSPGFDELSGPWQWATINPGVTYLVAGVGLWILASWGAIVWFYGAGCEIAMHTLFAGTFEPRFYPVALQLALIGGYLWLRRSIREASSRRFGSPGVTRKLVAGDLAISIRRMVTGATNVLSKILVLTRLASREKKKSLQ